MVLETELSSIERQKAAPQSFEIKARLLATQYSNSAFHGAALDRNHIGSELNRFLREVEAIHGISKAEIATHGVYFSHETCTHASSASSCAGNEIAALRFAFGNALLSIARKAIGFRQYATSESGRESHAELDLEADLAGWRDRNHLSCCRISSAECAPIRLGSAGSCR